MKTVQQPRWYRPAWIEIDLNQLRQNFALIHADKPKPLRIISVIKDQAYGHGAVPVAKAALESGAAGLAVATLEEGVVLREGGIAAPILMLGERHPNELRDCLHHRLTCSVSDVRIAKELATSAEEAGTAAPVHLKIDTGMSRYGIRWNKALPTIAEIASHRTLRLEGVMSHFAMSDETDKSFALEQLGRFQTVLAAMREKGFAVKYRHLCNTGGFLDLPQAHFDQVRIGILPLGVFPSAVCRRIAGIEPVMTVKAQIASIQNIEPGDTVGYGLRYRAPAPRRIGVLPIGYGDGFPRVRNQGEVLVCGKRAPLVGSVAMDAITIDITDIPEAQLWEEVVVMGRQGSEMISVHDMARLKNSVSYDVLAGWRERLPKVFIGASA